MLVNLRTLRESRWFTQDQIAIFLGISRPTYVRIEAGRTELTLTQAQKIAEKFQISLDDLTSDVFIEGKTIDKDKYKQIITSCIAYGASEDGKITKTKLAKLVYLVDFWWYYEHLEPMTRGIKYRRIAQWPVPDVFFSVVDELQDESLVHLELKGNAQLLENTESPSTGKLTPDELTFIEKVCTVWKGKNTKEIVDFTHEQLPWQICYPDEEIPFVLITQEDPDHVYQPKI